MDSSDNKLELIKAILYANDDIDTEEKLNAVRYLVYGWDKEPDIDIKKPWFNDLSIETRDIVNGLSGN